MASNPNTAQLIPLQERISAAADELRAEIMWRLTEPSDAGVLDLDALPALKRLGGLRIGSIRADFRKWTPLRFRTYSIANSAIRTTAQQ